MNGLAAAVAQRLCSAHQGDTCEMGRKAAEEAVEVFQKWLMGRQHDSVTAALLELANGEDAEAYRIRETT